MKVVKALILLCALAIATFLIGVGRYNADYAEAHHITALPHAV